MKRVISTITLLMAFMVLPALAQKDCGDGLPCGKLLWDLPLLPTLLSPTPMPTIFITTVPTGGATATSGPTATPAPTGTIAADFSDINHQFQTLQAVVAATPIPVNVSGTPVDPGAQLSTMSADAGTFFSYARGLSAVNLGGWTPVLALAFLSAVLMFSLKAIGFILPVTAVLFRLILRIVEVVKQLIGL